MYYKQIRDLPTLVAYSNLKPFFINIIYALPRPFLDIASILRQLKRREMSVLKGIFDGVGITSDARLVIVKVSEP